MTRTLIEHDCTYTCIEMIHAQQYFNSAHFSRYMWFVVDKMIKNSIIHDDVIKWKHFPRCWPFVSPVNSPHKGQRREALMFSLICAWTNRWVNNPNAGDLNRYRAHYDVTVIYPSPPRQFLTITTIIKAADITVCLTVMGQQNIFICNVFRFSMSFYLTPNRNMITRNPNKLILLLFY